MKTKTPAALSLGTLLLMLAALVLTALFAGCYSPDLGGTCYVCGDSNTCPDGSGCVAGLCTGKTACAIPCSKTISEAGAANFSIGFNITTSSTAQSTMLYQRARCDAQSDFWNVLLLASGKMTMELAKPYASLTSTVAVNDGRKHEVYIRRIKEVLTFYVDNAPAGSIPASQEFGQLPPLGVAQGHPCEASGLNPIAGTITEVCLWVKP